MAEAGCAQAIRVVSSDDPNRAILKFGQGRVSFLRVECHACQTRSALLCAKCVVDRATPQVSALNGRQHIVGPLPGARPRSVRGNSCAAWRTRVEMARLSRAKVTTRYETAACRPRRCSCPRVEASESTCPILIKAAHDAGRALGIQCAPGFL